jgi:hypothetical protein
MKMTVRDCLELPAFKKAVIISGKQGLDNRVSAVSFLESGYSPDQIQSNRYRSDEMILSAFFPDGSNEETQLQLIRSIAKEGGAALVLMPPAAISEGWTQHVINLSNDLKLPIISIQDDHELAYSDIINQVMEQVLYGDNFGNRLITNTIYHLLNFEKHSNFQSAVREAAINNNFQIVILSEDFNPVFSVETRHRTTIAEAIRVGIERDVDKSAVYTRIDVDGALTY